VLVAHTFNPSYSGGKRSGGLLFEASLGKYFMKPYLKNTQHTKKKKNGGETGGVAQGIGPEFKLQYHQKKKN
jgi:hypothetical protein